MLPWAMWIVDLLNEFKNIYKFDLIELKHIYPHIQSAITSVHHLLQLRVRENNLGRKAETVC